jgi:hypothetical protein
MNLNTALALTSSLILGASLSAPAAPYLVYQGTIAGAGTLASTESAAIQAKINAKPANFHKLPAALQKEITAALAKSAGATTETFYLITDEANVANYTFLVLNPAGGGGKIDSVTGSNLTAQQLPENFLSGFEFPGSGGLGLFRLGFTHTTGIDHVTNQIGAIDIQIYGTGPINSTANATIAPKQAAETFNVIVNGVKGALVTVPAFPAIVSTGEYIPSLSGTAFSYYFDDAATQTFGGASTKGTFTMAINPSLTQLANNGGRYTANKTNVANIAPIAASTNAAYKTFLKSVLAVGGSN